MQRAWGERKQGSWETTRRVAGSDCEGESWDQEVDRADHQGLEDPCRPGLCPEGTGDLGRVLSKVAGSSVCFSRSLGWDVKAGWQWGETRDQGGSWSRIWLGKDRHGPGQGAVGLGVFMGIEGGWMGEER